MIFFLVRLDIIFLCSLGIEELLSSSSGNLSWTEYHPLQHHQEYLQYLQQNWSTEAPHAGGEEGFKVAHKDRLYWPVLAMRIGGSPVLDRLLLLADPIGSTSEKDAESIFDDACREQFCAVLANTSPWAHRT